MKGILSVALFLLAAGAASAQQQPQFSHYGFNGMAINPAYAGIKGQGEILTIGRSQYYNYNGTFDGGGAPQTFMLSANLPIPAIGGGLGLVTFRDKLGELTTTNLQLSYSRHLTVGEGKLGLGVQGVFNHLYQGNYRPREQGDPNVPLQGSDQKVDVGVGVWYESDKFYAGLNANNFLRSEYRFSNTLQNASTARYTNENHAYFTAGYNIDASSSVVVTPTVLVKAVLPGGYGEGDKFNFRSNSYEAGVRATFNDRFWGGLAYRYDESITGLAGLSFAKDNAFRVGVAYDLIAFHQGATALSSYEIMLAYRLPKPSLNIRPAIRTPRYSF